MYYKLLLLFASLTLMDGNEVGSEEQENLVPNAGFESFSILPHGWFYRGSDFTALVKDWSSASEASPDVYGPNINVPDTWQQRGFGKKRPRSGKYMVGITSFGCNQGKPHCREYIQVNLKEPLIPGQAYHIEFWASPLNTGMRSNNLGIYFSKDKLQEKTDRVIPRAPHVHSKRIVPGNEFSWHKVQGDITAKEASKFLIIGNFYSDEETQNSSRAEGGHAFAYYYVDDVVVHKRPPIISSAEDEFSDWYPLEENKVITLDNIFFDTDKATIRPKGRSDLTKLLHILQEYPTMEIEVGGHCDYVGSFDYNMDLSLRRARSVVSYLVEYGINSNRLSYIGYGTTRPIATNQNEEGRQQNRRVEFRIIKI